MWLEGSMLKNPQTTLCYPSEIMLRMYISQCPTAHSVALLTQSKVKPVDLNEPCFSPICHMNLWKGFVMVQFRCSADKSGYRLHMILCSHHVCLHKFLTTWCTMVNFPNEALFFCLIWCYLFPICTLIFFALISLEHRVDFIAP